MRMITIVAASTAVILAGTAYAQAPSTERPAAKPPASSQEAPAGAPTITSVKVVEIDELPDASKAQVNQLVATRTADELEKLRQAIEKAPAVKSAVEAKGFSTRDVVLAQVSNEGELTIVTRKTS
jgi:PPE-repeat protein